MVSVVKVKRPLRRDVVLLALGSLVLVAAVLAWGLFNAPDVPQAVVLAPDDPIQQTLDAAEPGTVFALQSGRTYTGPWVIRVPGLVLQGHGARLEAGKEEDVLTVRAAEVTVEGLTVRGGARGLVVDRAAGVVLQGNRLLGSEVGIEVSEAEDITIQDNELEASRFMGISLSRAVSRAVLTGNVLRAFGGIGIRLAEAAQVHVRDNELHAGPASEIGVEISLGRDNELVGNVLVGTGNEGGQVGLLLQSTAANWIQANRLKNVQLGLQEELSRENRIRANAFDGGLLAMRLNKSEGLVLEENLVRGTLSGIYLLEARSAQLRGNRVEDVQRFGLQIEFTHDSQVEANAVTRSGTGIMAAFTQGTTFVANALRDNGWGLVLVRSQANVVTENRAEGNEHVGIGLLLSSVDNRVHANALRGNAVGLRLILAPNNTLTRNEIADNAVGLALIHSGNGTQVRENRIDHNEIGLQVAPIATVDLWDTVLSQFQIPLSIPRRGDNLGYRIEHNNLVDNARYGLQNLDENLTLEALNNWWGSPAGPPDPGQGNAISANVRVKPWLLEEIRWETKEPISP